MHARLCRRCALQSLLRFSRGSRRAPGCSEHFIPQCGAFFKSEVDLKSHLSRYWLNAHPEDPVAFDQQVKTVCDVCEQTPKLHEQGGTWSVRMKKTGIQALEGKDPTLPTRPGLIERRQFESIRHGTLCLMANFEVALGKILTPSLELARTEEDYLAHIAQTVV
jgi:hypothetical protein